MKHDCRLRSLDVYEDEDGYLFLKDQFNMPFGKDSRVEYCPVCGMQGKKSHVGNFTTFESDVRQPK
jgi:hypothetical protein